jgi:hypothetical protein
MLHRCKGFVDSGANSSWNRKTKGSSCRLPPQACVISHVRPSGFQLLFRGSSSPSTPAQLSGTAARTARGSNCGSKFAVIAASLGFYSNPLRSRSLLFDFILGAFSYAFCSPCSNSTASLLPTHTPQSRSPQSHHHRVLLASCCATSTDSVSLSQGTVLQSYPAPLNRRRFPRSILPLEENSFYFTTFSDWKVPLGFEFPLL